MQKLIGILLFSLAFSLVSTQTKPGDSAERDALYAWFDSLGMNEVIKGQLVRVETWSVYEGKKQEDRIEYGFLGDVKAKTFTLRGVSLRSEELPYEGQKEEHHPIAIEDFAKTILDTLVTQDYTPETPPEQLIARDSYQFFVLSRALYARGDKDLADKLYAHARALKPKYGDGYGMSFSEYIKEQIAQVMQPVIGEEVGDPKVTWSQALANIDTFEEHFPKTDAAETIAKLRKSVAVVVEERKTHPMLTAEKINKLPVEDQVRELIFELPDQTDARFSQPAFPGMPKEQEEDKSPAALLLKIGFAAVPQLIDALADTRPTKFGHSGDPYGGFSTRLIVSGTVFPVDWVAQRILERMAGRSFQGPYGGIQLNSAEVAAVQNNARAWWLEINGKSEKDALIAEIRTDTAANVMGECQRLAELYPQDAAGSIEAAIKDPKNYQYSSYLFETLASHKIPVVREFRWDEMLHGSSLDIRLSALNLNLDAEREATLDWLIKECKETAGDQRTTANIHPRDVIEILAQSTRAEGLELLQSEVPKMDEDQLYDLISSLDGVDVKNGEKPKQDYCEALEKLLQRLLLHSGRWHGGGSWGGMDITNARICDLAAFVLAEQMPSKYHYAATGSVQEKDRQRIAEINQYRKEHGEPPLGLPITNKVTRAESCTVRVVTLTGATEAAPLAARAALALKGQVLTADGIDSVIKAAANKWPKALHKLSLKATRDSYGSGVVLIVDFSTTAPLQNDWDFSERDILGSEDVQNSAGGGSQVSTPDHAKLAQLFGADAYTPFEISYSITHKG